MNGYSTEYAKYLMGIKVSEAFDYITGSVLNYGCGDPDLLYKELITYEPYTAYDPFIKGKENLGGKFDTIFCSLVLEHVDNAYEEVDKMMAMCNKYLICIVPNAYSLNRLLRNQHKELTEWDLNAGHRRLFTWESFLDLFKNYDIEKTVGIGFKPVMSDLMPSLREYWNEYTRYGKNEGRDNCAEMMVIVTKKLYT